MSRNIKTLFLLALVLFLISISSCLEQKEAQSKAVRVFTGIGADQRSYASAVDINSFFAPESGGKYTYSVVRPSASVYAEYSSKAFTAINSAQTMGVITSSAAENLIPIIREIKWAFDLYQGLDEQGMVQGRFYIDKNAVYSAGVVMVIDTQTITDPAKIQNLAWSWIKKQMPRLSIMDYHVELQKDFYVLNNRWAVIIAATTDESYNHLAKYAPGAKAH